MSLLAVAGCGMLGGSVSIQFMLLSLSLIAGWSPFAMSSLVAIAVAVGVRAGSLLKKGQSLVGALLKKGQWSVTKKRTIGALLKKGQWGANKKRTIPCCVKNNAIMGQKSAIMGKVKKCRNDFDLKIVWKNYALSKKCVEHESDIHFSNLMRIPNPKSKFRNFFEKFSEVCS